MSPCASRLSWESQTGGPLSPVALTEYRLGWHVAAISFRRDSLIWTVTVQRAKRCMNSWVKNSEDSATQRWETTFAQSRNTNIKSSPYLFSTLETQESFGQPSRTSRSMEMKGSSSKWIKLCPRIRTLPSSAQWYPRSYKTPANTPLKDWTKKQSKVWMRRYYTRSWSAWRILWLLEIRKEMHGEH